jgi:hypothetical protein
MQDNFLSVLSPTLDLLNIMPDYADGVSLQEMMHTMILFDDGRLLYCMVIAYVAISLL